MADRTERWRLNHLIEMCRDEELTLRLAADHVLDPAVKKLFVDLASQRARFAEALLPHAQRLGGAEATDHTTRGALHRTWMTLRGTLMGYSDRQMIVGAAHDDQRALAAYEEALDAMLPPTARDLVEGQCDEVRRAHARLEACLPH